MAKTISTKFMDIQETADYCRMTVRTVYNLTSQRKMPFMKPNNGRLLFDREAIDAWLQQSAVKPIQSVELDQVRRLHQSKGVNY